MSRSQAEKTRLIQIRLPLEQVSRLQVYCRRWGYRLSPWAWSVLDRELQREETFRLKAELDELRTENERLKQHVDLITNKKGAPGKGR